MISKEAVECYLRANDVQPSAPDDEIKEILLRAKWDKRDVDTALTVLRENAETKETHIDTLHRVFHSDERLEAETVSALLGIHVDVSEIEAHVQQRNSVVSASIIAVLLTSVSLTIVFVGVTMWLLKMGPFYTG
jgi:hypothetical protein